MVADRKVFNSSSPPPVSGPDYMDQIAGHIDRLYDNMSLIPTSITNSGNDYTAIIDPILDADVVAGMSFLFRPNVTNTGNVRLRITALNAWYSVVKSSGEALAAGDFNASTVYLLAFIGGEFRILSVSADNAQAGAQLYYYDFLTSTTWVKPAGLKANAIVDVELIGGGGGGGVVSSNSASGGGGGAFRNARFRASNLTNSVSIAVGNGGAAGAVGGTSSFGSYITCPGGNNGTGGGASLPGGAGGTVNFTMGIGGNGSACTDGVGGNGAANGASNASAQQGGSSIYGGGGGASKVAGTNVNTSAAGGISAAAGNGGANVSGTGQPGVVPGGGGACGAAGGSGRVRIRITT